MRKGWSKAPLLCTQWPPGTAKSSSAARLPSLLLRALSTTPASAYPPPSPPSPAAVRPVGIENIGAPRPVGSKRKRRLVNRMPDGSSQQLGRWERVVPASSRMIEYLKSSEMKGVSVDSTSKILHANASSTLTSALQLARFYLQRRDFKAAQELLFALQDGHLGPPSARKIPSVLIRPLLKQLVEGHVEAQEAGLAVESAKRMVRAGGDLSPTVLVGLLRACRGSRMELLAPLWAERQPEWAGNQSICLALLEALGAYAQEGTVPVSWSSLPHVDEVWRALCANGPPPPSAYALRIMGLAASAKAAGTAGDVGKGQSEIPHTLRMAVRDFAAENEEPLQRGQVLRAAVETLLQVGGKAEDVADVLEVLAPPAGGAVDGKLHAALLRFLPPSRLDALQVLWDHACRSLGPAQNPPLGLRLAFCRHALHSPSRALVKQGLSLLRTPPVLSTPPHPASPGRSSSQSDGQAAGDLDMGDVTAVLEALCGQGRVVEARALQDALQRFLPSPLPAPLARALLKCAALEGRPGRAIACLHRLKGEDVRESEGGGRGEDVTEPADYEAALLALRRVQRSSATVRERELVENPLGFLAWALDDAGTSTVERRAGGPVLTPQATLVALQILRRACETSAETGRAERREAFVQRAVALVSKLAAAGQETDDTLCEEMVGVAVWGGSLHRAVEVVREMEKTRAAPASLARAQTLLIISLARRGDVGAAEEWLVRMNTLTGHGPSEQVLDAFAEAYAGDRDLPSGLSMLQSCFNQYGTRPSVAAFRHLFELCLAMDGQGDLFEAQRALTIAEQLWPGGEEPGVGGGLLEDMKKRFKEVQESSFSIDEARGDASPV